MKAVQLLINSLLPEDLRDYSRTYDVKALGKLLATVAEKYPDRYADISKAIGDVGRKASYLQGETLTLDDFKPVVDRDGILAQMDGEIQAARKIAKSDEEFNDMRQTIWSKYSDDLEKMTMSEALKRGNNLGYSVVSGARGKAPQLKAMITTPGLYADYKENIIPMFVRNSFSEGLRPAEFLAGTFGARSSVLSTKRATADGGDYGKQLAQLGSTITVTQKDCGTTNGIDLNPDDPSLRGRVLAQPVAGIPAGTVIDRTVLKKLQNVKGKILVRSAVTCQSGQGVCAHCAGLKMDGKMPSIGESIGVSAAQALCLGAGTLVRMLDGSSKRIQDIVPGDVVFGSDHVGRLVPTKVKAVWMNGKRDCNRYKFRVLNDGFVEVVATADHRILAHEWKRTAEDHDSRLLPAQLYPLGELKDRHYAAVPQSFDDTGLVYYPEARLLGVLLGDGCINGGVGSGGIGLSCYDQSMMVDLVDDFCTIGLHARSMGNGEYRLSSLTGSSDDYQTTSNGTRVRNALKRVLINEGLWGLKAKDKKLPSSVSLWDNESVFALIAGLIATDGHVVTPDEHHTTFAVGISSNSRLMLEQLRHLLQTRLGVRCGDLHSSQKKNGKGGVYDATYSLSITGKANVDIIADKIGPFVPGVKRARLEQCRNACEDIKRKRYIQARLVEVEPVGELETYDLHVDHPDHLFMLDNMLLVHNSEPVTQNALNSKHTAGQAKGKRTFAGFDVLDAFVQTPDAFPFKAEVAKQDGRVTKIEDAPQGGKYVYVGEDQHYVQPGFDIFVNPGDTVEAGDQLADGIIDTYDMVKHRGLGEGRRYYAERLKQVLDDSGLAANQRNTEILARAAIDHVVIDDADGLGDYLPDDTASYNRISADYTPPETVKSVKPDSNSIGQYLHAPALHYSIGTRVTPKVLKRIQDSGINTVQVDKEPPKFRPEMVRLRTAAHNNPDWLARMSTSYLKDNLSDSAVRGLDTDVESNYHWAPRIAYGAGFGQTAKQTGKF